MRLTTVAAALAAVSLSSAFSPAFADIVDNWQMGVNTSNAGNTHAEVQRFLDHAQPGGPAGRYRRVPSLLAVS